MRGIKFRFSFKVGSNIEFQYRTLDELLDCSFAHEEMVTLINEECGIYEIEDLIEFELISKDEYTGLKDKNGVEIFEGDIISNENDVFSVKICGYYSNTSVGFGVNYSPNGDESLFSIEPDPFGVERNFEVIGNIHENPELLESDNE